MMVTRRKMIVVKLQKNEECEQEEEENERGEEENSDEVERNDESIEDLTDQTSSDECIVEESEKSDSEN